RSIRWHDLRHTCASMLVSGAWGPAWRLEDVKEILGHSTITITQRYAHLAESRVRALAATTGIWLRSGYGANSEAAIADETLNDFNLVGRRGLEPRTY